MYVLPKKYHIWSTDKSFLRNRTKFIMILLNPFTMSTGAALTTVCKATVFEETYHSMSTGTAPVRPISIRPRPPMPYGLTTQNASPVKAHMAYMYNASISTYILMWHTIEKAEVVLFKKQVRRWCANLWRCELQVLPYVSKNINLARISRNLLTPIPRKDTHLLHPLYPFENLILQLYLTLGMKKTMCACTLSTKLQHLSLFSNSPEAETII